MHCGTQLGHLYKLDKPPLLHKSKDILQLLCPYFAMPKQEIFDVNCFVPVKSFFGFIGRVVNAGSPLTAIAPLSPPLSYCRNLQSHGYTITLRENTDKSCNYVLQCFPQEENTGILLRFLDLSIHRLRGYIYWPSLILRLYSPDSMLFVCFFFVLFCLLLLLLLLFFPRKSRTVNIVYQPDKGAVFLLRYLFTIRENFLLTTMSQMSQKNPLSDLIGHLTASLCFLKHLV